MMIHNPKPRIGIFTRPIDKGTSGSGHHLHEMVRTMLQINREKELFEFFVHYVKTDRDIYHLAKEVLFRVIPSLQQPYFANTILICCIIARSPYSLRSQVYE